MEPKERLLREAGTLRTHIEYVAFSDRHAHMRYRAVMGDLFEPYFSARGSTEAEAVEKCIAKRDRWIATDPGVLRLVARADVFRALLERMKCGGDWGCWCDVAIGNPNIRGRHSSLCTEIREAFERHESPPTGEAV